MENKFRRSLSIRNVLKKFPILNWLPKYTTTDALGDLVAGITVGLTVVPQSLAYANIAGLPPQYGLYGSFLGAFMYIFLGSCKDVPMGPTAIASLLTYQTLHSLNPDGLGPEYATLLCFLTGVIQLFMGLAGLGIVIDFISGPVSSGFTSAVALLIITSQLKDIFGIPGKGTTFPEMMGNLLSNIQGVRSGDTILGIVCIVVLLLMRLLADVKIGKEDEELSLTKRVINKSLWLIGTSRNAILVLICGIFGYYVYSKNWFLNIGYIPPGLPQVQFPHFSAENNTVSFIEMIRRLGSGVIVVPLIGVLENIAICKAFAHGKVVDASQELLAIGLCNIGNSMVQSYPGTGSLSRSAVNNSSGVRTPMGSVYTGILVVLALLFFTPCFTYIPRACLAAVIIAAVVFMVEVRVVKPIYRSKKSDLIPGLATFVACLILPLEIGILIGIGLNLVSILYHAARPKISIEIHKTRAGIEYLLITPDRCLIFPSVDYVRNLVTKHSMKKEIPVVIDCSHIYGADFTAAKVIEILTQDFSRRKQGLFFYNLKPSIAAIFEGVQPKNFFIYYDKHELDNLLRNNLLSEICIEKKEEIR
ncbi:sodium-independent sulfate anion transporter isoform X2 [Planococcus citri]